MKSQLGPLETKFFSWVQSRKLNKVRTGDLVKAFNLSKQQEADLFKNMSRSGLIVKLIRGLYLVPLRLPPGGKWTPPPFLMIDVLMRELNSKYQITGLVAFNFHRLDQQVPIETAVYNTVLSGRKQMGRLSFLFIKVKPDRLGEEQIIKAPGIDGQDISTPISSFPRAVFDAIYDYSRFNTLPKAYDWIYDRRKDKAFLEAFLKIVLQYGNVSAIRRIGCIFELFKIDSNLVLMLERSIKKTKSFIPLIPTEKPSGKVSSRWGVLINKREQW